MASSQIERDILKSFEDKRNGLMRVKNPVSITNTDQKPTLKIQ